MTSDASVPGAAADFRGDIRRSQFNYDLSPRTIYVDYDNSSWNAGLYGQVEWEILTNLVFNGGLRAYDLSNPYQPQEVAYFVPGTPKLSPKGAVQINDVWVDDRGLVYCQDRFTGGLYVVEWTQ